MGRAAKIVALAAAALITGCRAPSLRAEKTREQPASTASVPALKAPPKNPPADAALSPSGLASQIDRRGHGEQRAQLQDKVRVEFTAWNEKGKLVDSSQQHGGPVVFEVGGVIQGWTEALQEMQVGEKRRLWVPDALAYPGRPGYPRGHSVFDIELLEIISGTPPPPAPEDVARAPSDAVRTESGLAYKLLARSASTERPHPWDRVTIRVSGWTAEGKVLDHLPPHDRPADFDVVKVIPGWREALQLLAIGERARVWLPQALAYGGRAGLPAGALVFDIELVAIERKPEPPRAPASVARAPAGAQKTASGIRYRFLHRSGRVAKPALTERVELHYSAWTRDGALFDSSVVRGKPATLPLSRIIPGWAEGLQRMSEGDKALLWIPEQLAYGGKTGAPRGPLLYEVELLRIMR